MNLYLSNKLHAHKKYEYEMKIFSLQIFKAKGEEKKRKIALILLRK